MTSVTLLVAALGASTVPSVAVLDLQAVKVEPEVVGFCTQTLAARLAQSGLKVITPSDITVALGVERQRQLLGCGETSTNCTAELVGALGATAITHGQIAKLGDRYQFSLRLIDANGQSLAAFTDTAADEAHLVEAIERLANRTLMVLLPEAAVSTTRPSVAPWVTVGAGGVVSAVGAGLLGAAYATHLELVNPQAPATLDRAGAEQLADRGNLLQTTGAVALSLGVTALVAGIVWRVVSTPPQPAKAALAPRQREVMLTAGGAP